MNKSKYYSGNGDGGKSQLYTMEYVMKNDPILEVVGEIDELSCMIGVARNFLSKPEHDFDDVLKSIQKFLMDASSHIASTDCSKLNVFDESFVKQVEAWTNVDFGFRLPKLKNFIILFLNISRLNF
jgi:cob(I)alamin adenosyltransferase